MKKLLLSELQWNDRTKMILAAGLTGSVLLFAILFPLAFRRTAPQNTAEGELRLEEKTELFVNYRNGETTGAEISAETLESPQKGMADFCDTRMQGLIAACIDDEKLENTIPTGSEYTVLSDGERSMTVCRMWFEQKGDWQNWLDVFFDAETGEIYYLYLSKECLAHQEAYDLPVNIGSEDIQKMLADRLGGKLLYSAEDASGDRTAIISTEDGAICYTIGCAAYGNLADVKINCF